METWLGYLRFIPDYIADLIALVAQPKSFLRARNDVSGDNWIKALQFFFISCVLSVVLQISYIARNANLFDLLGRSVIIWASGVFLMALAIKLSWALVGGKASFSSVVLTHFYAYSVYLLLANFATMAFMGALNIYSPDYASRVIIMTQTKDIATAMHESLSTPVQPGVFLISIIYSWALGAATIAWTVAVWGAYRQLCNVLSRWRSFLAFLICIPLGIPFYAVYFLISAGGLIFRGVSK